MLVSTHAGRVVAVNKRWVNNHEKALTDFALLLRQKKWIPALRAASTMLPSLFQFDVLRDPLYCRLVECEAMFQEGWDTRPVSEVLALVQVSFHLLCSSSLSLSLTLRFCSLSTPCSETFPSTTSITSN